MTNQERLEIPHITFDTQGELIIAASSNSSKHDFHFYKGKWQLQNKKGFASVIQFIAAAWVWNGREAGLSLSFRVGIMLLAASIRLSFMPYIKSQALDKVLTLVKAA